MASTDRLMNIGIRNLNLFIHKIDGKPYVINPFSKNEIYGFLGKNKITLKELPYGWRMYIITRCQNGSPSKIIKYNTQLENIKFDKDIPIFGYFYTPKDIFTTHTTIEDPIYSYVYISSRFRPIYVDGFPSNIIENIQYSFEMDDRIKTILNTYVDTDPTISSDTMVKYAEYRKKHNIDSLEALYKALKEIQKIEERFNSHDKDCNIPISIKWNRLNLMFISPESNISFSFSEDESKMIMNALNSAKKRFEHTMNMTIKLSEMTSESESVSNEDKE